MHFEIFFSILSVNSLLIENSNNLQKNISWNPLPSKLWKSNLGFWGTLTLVSDEQR